MGTHALVLFTSKGETDPDAVIYKHWDGDPETMTKGLAAFFDAVQDQTPGDTRFNDPAYLAAKYIVHLAAKYPIKDAGPLGFTGVAPVVPGQDYGQAYTYAVVCDQAAWPPARPEVRQL